MKIVFAGKPICSGVKADSPKDFEHTGSRENQIRRYLRGPVAKPVDRLNETSQVTFTLIKSFDSIQAAEAFCLDFRLDTVLPKFGTLELTSDDGTHTDTSVRYMANAEFVTGRARHNGVNAYITYTFIGSGLSTKKP